MLQLPKTPPNCSVAEAETGFGHDSGALWRLKPTQPDVAKASTIIVADGSNTFFVTRPTLGDPTETRRTLRSEACRHFLRVTKGSWFSYTTAGVTRPAFLPSKLIEVKTDS